jgi:hypothetical protein
MTGHRPASLGITSENRGLIMTGLRGVAGAGCFVLVAMLLVAMASPAAARVPKSLSPAVAAEFKGKTLAVELGERLDFMVGPRQITDREEYARLKDMLGDALPQPFEGSPGGDGGGMWAVVASQLDDPTPGIATALEQSLQDRFGLVAAGGATEAGVASGDYLLLVEPIAWQLYHRSAFSDPAYAYAMKATLFEMPARKPLASRGCSDHNWGAVGKRPFLLGYFGDDAAAFRADVDRSRRACAAELIEKMLPPGAPAGN